MPNPVQSSTIAHGGGANDTITLTSQPTLGNQVIFAFNCPNQSGAVVASLVDNVSGSPNTYSSVKTAQWSTGFADSEIWWCPSVTPGTGTYTLTVNLSSSASGDNFTLIECAGLTGVDQTGSIIGLSTAVSTATATNSGVNTGTTDFVLAAFSFAIGSNPSLLTPSGYTNLALNNVSGMPGSISVSYRNDVSAVTDSVTWNWTTADNHWAGALASFTSGTPAAPLTPSPASLALAGQTPSLVRGTVITPNTAKIADRCREAVRSIFLPGWKRELVRG